MPKSRASATEKNPKTDNAQIDTSVREYYLTCGASLVRDSLVRLSVAKRKVLLSMLWPDISEELINFIANSPLDTRINGSQLKLPTAWITLSGGADDSTD
jgi:hypothetical protein